MKKYQQTPEVELLKQRLESLEKIHQEKEQEPARIIKALEAQHIQATACAAAARTASAFATRLSSNMSM